MYFQGLQAPVTNLPTDTMRYGKTEGISECKELIFFSAYLNSFIRRFKTEHLPKKVELSIQRSLNILSFAESVLLSWGVDWKVKQKSFCENPAGWYVSET